MTNDNLTRDALALILHYDCGDSAAVADVLATMDKSELRAMIAGLLGLFTLKGKVFADITDAAEWAAALSVALQKETV